jgi:hypothetical protein
MVVVPAGEMAGIPWKHKMDCDSSGIALIDYQALPDFMEQSFF